MGNIGPMFFAPSSGDHTPGDGLTRFQTAFAGASSEDISAFANGPGVNSGGIISDGEYAITVTSSSGSGLAYGTDTDLGRPSNTEFTFETFFTTDLLNASNAVLGFMGGAILSGAGGFGSGTWSMYLNGGTHYRVYSDAFNGAASVTAAVDFLTPSLPHHFAICINASGSYSVYLDGVRILGPSVGNNTAHSEGRFNLGGSTGGVGQVRFRFQGVRIRRAVMYSGASFVPPLSPADWGPP